jgi:UMF1 family MFS transporter
MDEKGASKRLRAWYLYDWANSAYVTTVAVTLLPAWFAKGIATGPEVDTPIGALAPESLWALSNGAAALLVFAAAPFFSAVADLSATRRPFLVLFAMAGATATAALSLMGPGMVMETLMLFMLCQVCFVSANIFYDSFLPLLVGRSHLDEASSRGYALGYVGGGINLLIAAGMISFHGHLGIKTADAIRAAMVLAGLWWAIFSIPAARRLKDPPIASEGGRPWPLARAIASAPASILSAARKMISRPETFRFLLAFLLYNEGIQTVIQMATIYGRQALGLSTDFLTSTLLGVQAVAAIGAISFSRLASRISALWAICLGLAVWIAIILYAAFLLKGPADYLILALAIGAVLGGTQALSRSLFASMVPAGLSAEYFSFYSVASKLAAVTGPLLFALSREYSGSITVALLSTLFFFLSGLALLIFGRICQKNP